MSMQFEVTYMHKLGQSHQHRAEHIAGFEMCVVQRMYGWVDTIAILEEETWKKFFKRGKSTFNSD